MRRLPLLLAATCLAGAALATETINYSYDARGRLVQVAHSGSVNNGVTTSYTIDKADNRTNKTVTGGLAAVPTFNIVDASGVEGSTLSFSVTRGGSTSEAVSVAYASANGTAVAPGDYTSVSGTLFFASGETLKTVSVATVDDLTSESDENFTVALSSPSTGAVINDGSATGTISDNDTGGGAPSFAINDVTGTEGSSLSFTVTRAGTSTGSYTVNYATSNGTASAPSDYTSASGTLTFASGQTSKTIAVTTIDDSLVESSETFNVTLSSPSGGATLSDAQGVGTITDNDTAGPPSFAISDASVVEGGALSFSVTKTGTTSSSYSVSFATANGTASAPGRYTATSGTLTFLSSEATKTISVSTNNNNLVQGDQNMYVNLSSPTGGATLSDSQGVGTIIDDDEEGGGGPCPSC